MEYGATVWDPYQKYNSDKVERVQHRAAKFVKRVVLSAKVKKEQHTLAAFWHPETEHSDGQEASTSYAPMASATSIEQQQANKLNTETAVKEYKGTHLRYLYNNTDRLGAHTIQKVYLPLFPETVYSLQRYCGLLNLS